MYKIIFFIGFYLILCTCQHLIFSQNLKDVYFITFTDKNNNPYTSLNPASFLSQRAIERRVKFNIPIIDSDLPVTPAYIDSLKHLGINILHITKWFNGVTVTNIDSNVFTFLSSVSFISSIKLVKPYKLFPPKSKKIFDELNELIYTDYCNINTYGVFEYGMCDTQIIIHNGHILHNYGYQGQGMLIAVCDAGFNRLPNITAFNHLYKNAQLKATRDFVDGDTNVYHGSDHGTMVLSVLAAWSPWLLIGTAPKADYLLLRTEDTGSEYIVEELNWIAAAEFADSIGADVITTSLGYVYYDDTTYTYTINDLNGKTAYISKGSQIAASKGMLVVTSAGNQGNNQWKRISFPADADSIISVGAVDTKKERASFSSIGPTADNRIKPDVMAVGKGTVVLGTNGMPFQGSGTSFSAPIIAGLSACLWQAFPNLSNIQLINYIKQNSDRANSPDNFYGYGIPNYGEIFFKLKQYNYFSFNTDSLLYIYPNPFIDNLNVIYYSTDIKLIRFELFDITGKKNMSDALSVHYTSYNIINITFSHLQAGVYILKIQTGTTEHIKKIIKI